MPISSYTHQFATLRPKLIAFALLQVQDRSHAEDLVQDALVGALEGIENYQGNASFDTWVYSILRNKLIDYIRRSQKERKHLIVDNTEIDLDAMFTDKNHWDLNEAPSHWHTPDDLHLRGSFWEVFDLCLLHLPTNTARVFALRELMDLETAEICECLDISEQNVWTILHRARLKLRGCLEKGWFLKGESE